MPGLNATQTLQTMQKNSSLVHHITNWVTINHCAQIVRHWGCLPVMAHAREEVEEMVGLAGALVLNIGTLTPELIEAMILAARAANKKGIPVVLDAVGVGATRLRTDQAHRILKEARVDVLKGNAGEIATLAGVEAEVRGVESISVGGDPARTVKELAAELKSVVAITGAKDLVSDGKTVLEVAYGDPMMGKVVGTGCIGSSTVGCFVTAGKDYLRLTALALACFGVAGERAAKKSRGPGDFIGNLFNEISEISSNPEGIEVEAAEL